MTGPIKLSRRPVLVRHKGRIESVSTTLVLLPCLSTTVDPRVPPSCSRRRGRSCRAPQSLLPSRSFLDAFLHSAFTHARRAITMHQCAIVGNYIAGSGRRPWCGSRKVDAACWPRLRTQRLWWCTNEHLDPKRTNSKSPAPVGTLRLLGTASVDADEHLHKVHVVVRRLRRQARTETPHPGRKSHPSCTPLDASAILRRRLDMGKDPPPELPDGALSMQ